VLGRATTIQQTLEDVQNPADKLGSRNILDRVNTANGILGPAKGDTGNILGQAQLADKLAKCIDQRLGTPGAC